jgi:hypothetical protein
MKVGLGQRRWNQKLFRGVDGSKSTTLQQSTKRQGEFETRQRVWINHCW